MMNQISCFVYLTIFLCLGIGNLNGQTELNFETQVSRSYKGLTVMGDFYPIIKGNEILYFNHSQGWSTINMQKYDMEKPMELKRKSITDLPKGIIFEELVELAGENYMFFSSWDRPSKLERLMYYPIKFDECNIGKEKLLIKSDIKLLANPTEKENAPLFNFSEKRFNLDKSNDGSKLLVEYRLIREHKNDAVNRDRIGLQVFDSGLNLIWEKLVKMPYVEQAMDFWDVAVDSDGNAYVLIKAFNELVGLKKGPNKLTHPFNYEILKYSKDSNEPQIFKVEFDESIQIKEFQFLEGHNNEMICAGFYSEKNKTDIKGLAFFKLAKGADKISMKSYEIPMDLLLKFKTEKEQGKAIKKDETGVHKLKLTDFVVEEDGKLLLVAEKQFESQNSVSSKSIYTYTSKSYKEVYITLIDSDGELLWIKRLQKSQSSGPHGGKGSMGQKLLKLGDEYCIFYIDHIDNIDVGIDEAPAHCNFGKMEIADLTLMAFAVNAETGKVKKYKVMKMKNANQKGVGIFLRMGDLAKMDDKSFVFKGAKVNSGEVFGKSILIK